MTDIWLVWREHEPQNAVPVYNEWQRAWQTFKLGVPFHRVRSIKLTGYINPELSPSDIAWSWEISLGYHGTANQAIEWVVHQNRDGQEREFLEYWQQGDLDEWPEFYEWLIKQK